MIACDNRFDVMFLWSVKISWKPRVTYRYLLKTPWLRRSFGSKVTSADLLESIGAGRTLSLVESRLIFLTFSGRLARMDSLNSQY